MLIHCRRCGRRAQIERPKIGQKLRCTSCNEVQVFGTRPRRRREVHGIVRFSDRRAPQAKAKHVSPFDDPISDLWKAG
jgi:DNA-directed RNA polymerase subunit RPC12/RpoP